MNPTVGAIIGGYKILDTTDDNGVFGLVFKAESVATSEVVALKMARRSNDLDAIARFKRESELLHLLSGHDNIVAPKSQLIIDGTIHMYAMEFLERSLDEVVELLQGDDPKEKLKIFIEICEGLKHAHSNNVYHRDLHHENVRFSSSELVPKLTDFGKSKAMDLSPLSDEQFIEWGGFVQPPEVRFRITEAPTNQEFEVADLYALGQMLFAFFYPPAIQHKEVVKTNIFNFIINLNPADPNSFFDLSETKRKQYYRTWLQQFDRNILNLLNIHLNDVNLETEISRCIKKMCDPDTDLRYQSINEIIDDIKVLL